MERGGFKRNPVPRIAGLGDLVAGDVDGDGDLDLICGEPVSKPSIGFRVALFQKNGKGVFQKAAPNSMPSTHLAYGIALKLADVDGDKDLDLIVAVKGPLTTPSDLSHLFMNDGKGHFTDETSKRLPKIYSKNGIEVGDVDGDGDQDLVFLSYGKGSGQSSIYLNQGKGYFKAASDPFPYDWDLAGHRIFDMDGDGDLDAIFFRLRGDVLFENDGKGTFKDVSNRLPLAKGYSGSFQGEVIDIDGNGTLDLMVSGAGKYPGYFLNLYRNDGKGNFSLEEAAIPRLFPWGGSCLMGKGDLDGDGDVDAILCYSSSNRPPFPPPGMLVLSNLERHLLISPGLRRGKTSNLETYARLDRSVTLVFAAPKKAKIPLSGIGLLQLDPAKAHLLASQYLPKAGRMDQALRVPNDQGLVGLSLSFQALVFDLKRFSYFGFTNAWTMKVK